MGIIQTGIALIEHLLYMPKCNMLYMLYTHGFGDNKQP